METKAWYKSNTLRGLVVIFLGAVISSLKLFGIEIPFLTEANLDGMVGKGLEAIGLLWAFVGRKKAQGPLS